MIAKETFASRPDPDRDLAEIIRLGRKRLATRADVAAVGISAGGMFDPRTGRFGATPHKPAWQGYPIVEPIREAFSLPVAADNDANACALAEWKYGAGRGTQYLAFLTFGTHLRAGLILDGRLYHGVSALAGETGATRIALDEPAVRNKPGCLEGYASGAGIAAMRRESFGNETTLPPGATAYDVAMGVENGDAMCIDIMRESGGALGRGLAILIDLLNLEVIVIGSIFVRCESLFRPAIEAALARDAMPASRQACRIVPAALGEQIGDHAALALAVLQEGEAAAEPIATLPAPIS